VDNSGTVGSATSLVVDQGTNNVFIGYYDATNSALKYASWESSTGTWYIQTVDSTDNVGQYESIDIDGSAIPHFAYRDVTNQALKYASWEAGAWSIQTIDDSVNVDRRLSIAVDNAGIPHIAYFDNTNYDLRYVAWDVESPLITVEAPSTAGITLEAGSTYIISWEASDDIGFPDDNYISIYFSSDGGTNWSTVATQLENIPNCSDAA
jgi:hypothetical protein